MRAPPKLKELHRYPVVAGVGLASIGVTLAWWAKVDISPLFETAMIRRGELWRLVTSMFPHVNAMHLIFNVYWLWVFGTLIEEVYGHLKTAALIVLLAAGSGALEYAFADGGVGLSGVGYGLFGLLWVLSESDEHFKEAVDRRTVELFVVWFFICIVTTVTKIMPVANIAHGAGAVLGALTGFAITRPPQRTLAALGICAILGFGLWADTVGRPRVNLSAHAGYEEAQLGYAAMEAKEYQVAVRWLRDAVVYQPKEAGFWSNLGFTYWNLGDKSASLAAYRKAAELGDAKAAYYLGSLYANGQEGLKKDEAQALAWYVRAANQGNAEAMNDAAWTYATSDDSALRNPAAALDYARKAVDQNKEHPKASHLDTLAEAYYVNGKYEDAVKTEEQAMTLAPDNQLREFQARLEKYLKAARGQKGNAKTE